MPPTSRRWSRASRCPPRRAPARRRTGARRSGGRAARSAGRARAPQRPGRDVRAAGRRGATDRGAEDNKQFYVRYTPGVEEVEIRQARIFRRGADGQVQILDAGERDDEDLSEPWYGLYYDNRAEVVRFEGLRAGDVLEVQYLIDDVSAKNQLADYFGDLQFIAEEVPKQRWDYTLIGPTDRAFYTNTPRLPRPRAAGERGGRRAGAAVRGARRRQDRAPSRRMPGYTEVAPYLHVSTYASWHEVGAWYWRLVEEQMVPDDSIRKAARSVLRAGDDRHRKACAPSTGWS